ncbi:CoxG family protein [Lichenibacterium dinghuense]|uniref:CoxG family protein n=1 Tax=Lichenibacterium dinghuense TaxID=2895977 RepID=UPI001F33B925|nr:carbon monoxide dehydrogenase subunit G [Lichenibacterium sp. 6Y81]
MAMTMTGEVALPVDRPTVWAKLNDPVTLKNCVGLIESMEQTGDDSFAFLVRAKIGPLAIAFRGRIVLTDVVPLLSYRINAQGEGGFAGHAGGHADVVLTDLPGGTLLAYAVELDLGGRLARMGARVMDGVAQRAADRFFAGFTRECLR